MILKLGDHGDKVKRLQKALCFLGYDLKIDGDYGEKTKTIIEEFQDARDIYMDGIVGPHTLELLDSELQHLNYTEGPLIPIQYKPELYLVPKVKVPADTIPGIKSYDHLTLRLDVANAYINLYNAVHLLGGNITTAGGVRPLNVKKSVSRSRTSMHYLGRAFDLALPTGMQNPSKDQYIMTQNIIDIKKWVVWCTTTLKLDDLERIAENHFKDKLQIQNIFEPAIWMNADGVQQKNIKRLAFNFTQLANWFGFHEIPSRSSFYSKHIYSSAEWWHFQYESGLIENVTTFGDELEITWKKDNLKNFPYWNQVKNLKYKKDWA